MVIKTIKSKTIAVAVIITYFQIVGSETNNNEIKNSDLFASEDVKNTTSTGIVITEQTLQGNVGPKSELCSKNPCIRKCCSVNSVAIMLSYGDNSGSCKSKKKLNLTLGSLDPPIYTEDLKVTEKHLNSTFEVLKGWPVIKSGWLMEKDFYILEDGSLLHETANKYDRWHKYDKDNYCVDFLYKNQTGDVAIAIFYLADVEIPVKKDYTIGITATLISSVFLLATLLVYGYVPRLRRQVHGKVVLAYSASLLGFFLTQSIYQLVSQIHGSGLKTFCHIMGVPTYYLMLASFFWINIMSFNIWLNFRKMANTESKSKRNSKLFFKYCAYGFGVPLAMIIVFAFLNYLPMEQINRAVVTPGITKKACFIRGMERVLYFYVPIMCLLLINIILFILTTAIICRLKKNPDLKNSYSHCTRKIILIVSMFIVMGLTWVLDFASFLDPSNRSVWIFIDTFNSLTGLFVFIIFVCNRRVISLLLNRYHRRTRNNVDHSVDINKESSDFDNSVIANILKM